MKIYGRICPGVSITEMKQPKNLLGNDFSKEINMEQNYVKTTARSTKPQSEGAAFYSDLKVLEFTPEKEVLVIKPEVKKGNWRFWKLLGIIPLIPIKARKDLYGYYGPVSRLYTEDINKYFRELYGDRLYKLEGNTVYKRACVYGSCHDKVLSRCRYFDTNKQAMEYFEHTKKECRKYGNDID